jgi:hypothetical protein
MNHGSFGYWILGYWKLEIGDWRFEITILHTLSLRQTPVDTSLDGVWTLCLEVNGHWAGEESHCQCH